MKTARLADKYRNEVHGTLVKELGCENVMEVPAIKKIVVNMSTDTSVDKDQFKQMTDELALITGQKPVITKARKSVSNFKLREGMPIGAKVTLRGRSMYEFLDRLLYVALPRIRDFRGISRKAFDGRGNYNLGLNEQSYFPEIDPDRIKRNQGMDITIVTSAKTDADALALLKHMGFPFEN